MGHRSGGATASEEIGITRHRRTVGFHEELFPSVYVQGDERNEMTGDTPMRVDHVGIAVESIEEAEPVLRAFGVEKLTDERTTEFRWAYYRLGNGSRLELIEPADTGENGDGDGDGSDESFLTDFLDRHGPGLHHVTLEVADLDRAIERVEAAGLRVVDRADESDWREAFVSPANPTGTLFQLMEYREGFAENRDTGAELFVGGRALGETNKTADG